MSGREIEDLKRSDKEWMETKKKRERERRVKSDALSKCMQEQTLNVVTTKQKWQLGWGGGGS